MIIPVVFTLLPLYDNLIYTWIFYKGVDLAKHYGWPVFAQQQYFTQTDKQRKYGWLTPEMAAGADYEPYSPADSAKYIHEVFPQELIDRYIARFPSQTDAFLASMKEPWPEMTEFLIQHVQQCEKKLGDVAEAFICLGAPQFVRDAAAALKIRVIHYEWGPLRAANYRNTAYFDFEGSVCDGSMLKRYKAFQKISEMIPVFSKKEILAFFLQKDQLERLTKPDGQPTYQMGLALGYHTQTVYSALNQASSVEALSRLHEYFTDEELCVRYHPGDPVHSVLEGPTPIKGNLIDFILDSERIACISSNITYEAMLWNRPAYDLGATQYGQMANHQLKGLPDQMASEEFLSFIAFGYIIPFELLKSVEYIRWRLSEPSEKEIYLYHLSYYCRCLDIDQQVLSLKGEARLAALLHQRDASLDGVTAMAEDSANGSAMSEIARAYAKIEKLKTFIDQQKTATDILEKQHLEFSSQIATLRQQLEAVINENMTLKNSHSWQITAPLRNVKPNLKKMIRKISGSKEK